MKFSTNPLLDLRVFKHFLEVVRPHKSISFIWIVWSTLYVYLWQLRHLWSNCKMLWATRPEFECIKKNSNLEWNLILVSWAFFYTHNTVEKSNRGKLFSQFNYCYLTWLHLYCSILKKKRKSTIHCIEVYFCTLKNISMFLTKLMIFGPCMRKTGCFNLYSLLYLICKLRPSWLLIINYFWHMSYLVIMYHRLIIYRLQIDLISIYHILVLGFISWHGIMIAKMRCLAVILTTSSLICNSVVVFHTAPTAQPALL